MNESITLMISAFGIGVLHALEPGHGKALMVGTLVNARHKWLDPFLLACSTAVGHMLGVLVFAMTSFFLAHELTEGRAKLYLESGIGAAVAVFGLFLLRRTAGDRGAHTGACRCCAGVVGISKNGPSAGVSKHLGPVGLLIGLVPCPSALALAASTASLVSPSRVLSVAFVFGLGVAVSLLLIGLSITLSSRRMGRLARFERLTRYGVYVGPLSLMVVGTLMAFHAGAHRH